MMSAYNAQNNVNAKVMTDIMNVISSYNSFIMILLIPFFALTTKIAFRKWGHNYYEHIVINAYILTFYTLISIIVVYPIMFYFRHSSPSIFFNISQLSLLLVPVILIWFFKAFYSNYTFKKILLKVLVVIALTILGFILLMIFAAILAFIYAMLKGAKH